MECPSVGFTSKFAPKNIERDGKPKISVAIVETAKKDHIVTVHIRCKKSIEYGRKSPKIIIFSQPNSTDLGYVLFLTNPDLIEICDFLKCDLVAYDYSGFGASTGKISEKALYANIEAVFKYVTNELNYQPQEVILMGFSMGTAMSIHMASIEKELGCVILIAPFTSLLRAASRIPCCGRRVDSETTCCLDQFSSYDKASLMKARTLLCHGDLDTLVVRKHSEVLYKRLQNAVEPFYSLTCHTGIFSHTRTWIRIKRFINEEMRVNDAWAEIR
uniref:Serine hydrolase FSH domain-containing protein n=1 Tax=Acrobeloides nanus TaxID=290746 RepID=A0A914ERE2_9BILA